MIRARNMPMKTGTTLLVRKKTREIMIPIPSSSQDPRPPRTSQEGRESMVVERVRTTAGRVGAAGGATSAAGTGARVPVPSRLRPTSRACRRACSLRSMVASRTLCPRRHRRARSPSRPLARRRGGAAPGTRSAPWGWVGPEVVGVSDAGSGELVGSGMRGPCGWVGDGQRLSPSRVARSAGEAASAVAPASSSASP